MICPQCSYANPETSIQCGKCSTPLPLSDQTLATGVEGWSVPSEDVVISLATPAQLSPGTVLAARYEIIRLLGQGGMGAVYQARDHELERQVALKVIRADMVANPEILKRFKQELILARQITHKNVIRIFDLGQADGIKFITMEYIEGEDLQSILRRKKKLEPAEAANIIAQISRALEAAHAEGVIHRDLKPQNIMLDKSGRAYVMDFGIARSLVASGMTQTGALIGTPDYMSPEQAKGLPLDARSDLFTVGIIFYEILSGQPPFESDTTMGKLWKRTSEPARPLGELDQTIPQALCDIVRKCLEIHPQKRFASATELLQQIENWQGPSAETRLSVQRPAGLPAYAKWVGAGLALVLVTSGYFLRGGLGTHPVAPHARVTLLISDFDNKTGDGVFDETLEPAFIIGLEGAPFIERFPRSTARKLAAQLRPGATILDEPTARLVATREGIGAIVVGSISKEGNQYAIQVKTVEGITGKTIGNKTARVGRKDVLSAVGQLGANVRSVLGDTTPESLKLSEQETFTADSLEAAHEYAEAQNLQWDGRWEESLPHFERAINLDPNMGRAYAGYAVASFNLGRHTDALKHFQNAMAHIDRMTDREKYRTRASYYITRGEPRKAIEEYTSLLKLYPYDDAAHSNLAISHFYLREMDKAVEVERRDVEINPRGLMQRTNLSLYEAYGGNFSNAVKEAQEVLKQNPKSVSALGALAMGQLGMGKVVEATAAYEQMRTISARGATSSATGLADIALYEGRLKDATDLLENGIKNDQASKNTEAIAIKLNYLAYAYLVEGQNQLAGAAAEKALTLSRDPSILYEAGHIEAALGQSSKVVSLASELGSQLSSDSQSYGKLILGEVALKNADARGALSTFQEAQKIADSWLVHYDLGRAYLAIEAFAEASSEFDTCMKRRGEAAAVFLDDVPSYHLYPPVLYYQGMAQEGLKSAAAADYFKQFLAIKATGVGDPMIADARRRLGLN